MNRNKVLLIVFCLLLPLFLILFSYKTTLFFIDLNLEQKETINFLHDDGRLNLNYTSAELSHLNDVKKVMLGANYFFYGMLLVLSLILTYYRKNIPQTKKLLKYGGLTTVILVLIIFLCSLTNFDFVFNLFHLILFPQGNWVFASDSLLIQTFPIDFFTKTSKIIFIQTLLWGIVFYTLPSFFKK